MHRSAHVSTAALLGLLISANAGADVILYVQDFETPNNPPGFIDTTGKDVSQQLINDLYGGQPAGFTFLQVFTVETIEINGGVAFGSGYSDPSGIGGQFAAGMLSSVQDDKLRLTFDVGIFDFLNFEMDISSIDLDGVGGPFGPPGGVAPEFRLTLYDSPGGTFTGTTSLSTGLGSGTASARNVFDWTKVVFGLSTAGNTDGNVTVEIDLLFGNYAAFDNIAITASDVSAVPIPPAVWLFGSALGLLGWMKRRKTV